MLELNKVIEQSGQGGANNKLTKLLFGINHQMQGITGIENTDTQGFAFWPRPELNLSYDNLRKAPELEFLYNAGPYSMGAVIRNYLDPINKESQTPLVDPLNAFIPMLTNLCLDLSGAPDIVADLYTSDNGKFDEQWFIPVGISGVYNIWESSSNFQNVKGDPITALFFTWITYINRVAEGSFEPHLRNMAEDEIDSNTRQFRIITDQTKRFYTKYMAAVASIPTASTIGSAYDMNRAVPYLEANQQISVPFSHVGADYQCRSVVDDFNDVVANFNSGMIPDDNGEISQMVKLSPGELKALNFSGYPRMNNGELEWYVTPEQYERYLIRYNLKDVPEGENASPEENDYSGIFNSALLNLDEDLIKERLDLQVDPADLLT